MYLNRLNRTDMSNLDTWRETESGSPKDNPAKNCKKRNTRTGAESRGLKRNRWPKTEHRNWRKSTAASWAMGPKRICREQDRTGQLPQTRLPTGAHTSSTTMVALLPGSRTLRAAGWPSKPRAGGTNQIDEPCIFNVDDRRMSSLVTCRYLGPLATMSSVAGDRRSFGLIRLIT